MRRRKQMYFAGMSCDKVTEDTVAFQVATIPTEITPRYSHGGQMCERLKILMEKDPKGMVAIRHPYMENFSRQFDHIESMCEALLPSEHCYDVGDLSSKLLRVMTANSVLEDVRLVAVTIMDGRLCFKLWQRFGLIDIKVLPTEIRGCDCFDFGLQMSPKSRDGVRIACMLLDGARYQYVVEWYRRGKRNEIIATKTIEYKPLKPRGVYETRHFNGHMETFTVQ